MTSLEVRAWRGVAGMGVGMAVILFLAAGTLDRYIAGAREIMGLIPDNPQAAEARLTLPQEPACIPRAGCNIMLPNRMRRVT